MALQESIKRTETNQQIATAIFHTSISQPSGHSVTKLKVISYELYRNGGPVLPSTPFLFSDPSPPPQAELAVSPKAQQGTHSKHEIFSCTDQQKYFSLGHTHSHLYSFHVFLSIRSHV